jgi:hypothetical protein
MEAFPGVSVPMQGSLWPERGTLTDAAGTDPQPIFVQRQWSSGESFVAMAADFSFTLLADPSPGGFPVQWAFVAGWADGTTGEVEIQCNSISGPSLRVFLRPGELEVQAFGSTGNPSAVFTSWPGGLFYMGVGKGTTNLEITLKWDGGFDTDVLTVDAGWSAECTEVVVVNDGAGMALAGLQAGREAVVESFTNVHEPTASIDLSPNELDATPGVDSEVARDVLREVAEAELGAVWLDELGHAVFRSRTSLRGIGQPVHAITSRTNLADLAWRSSIDQLRSQVRVPILQTTSSSSTSFEETVWEATDKIRLSNLATVILFIDLDATAIDLNTGFGKAVGATGSRVMANTAEDGSGSNVSAKVAVALEQLGPRRVKLRIRNGNNAPVWLVNTSGDPYLVLRARHKITQSTEPVWATAENPGVQGDVLELPANRFRQDSAVGNDVALFLRAETAEPRPVLEPVTVLADTRRQLGDIVEITDPDVTGMDEVRGVVVGVETVETPGSRSQALRVRTLGQIIADFNAAWDAHDPDATIADFNAERSGETIADFNLDPLRTP